ncbi:DUF262 domain-containing protein [Mesomycoplasma molare]|uniref:DUF262 domain-containing HNH endonuclease family protein n=1 Tax=Mesomycoplasma molare TaxID=171288 RepID=A0ABY5TV43_9BACT|nr:DUF262 domain-containing protein [Mesomycoplasma molare]UWD34534.1 DUF262 domain-containing HNH endonuclease family protein [Mesomycoplasma molare]
MNNINENKKTIFNLLSESQEKEFLIPEYQRPYSWTEEQVETLFNDIWDFYLSKNDLNKEENYFLGSIVSFINSEKQNEIIDGQQRITSLLLLLRAIHKILENSSQQSEEAKQLSKDIEICIWKINNKISRTIDKNSLTIKSEVINKKEEEIFQNILITGEAKEKAKDNYSKNYIKLEKLIEEKMKNEAEGIYNFFYIIIHEVVVFPITANSQDTALTIFFTLNNRGMLLSDSDIFKSSIYKSLVNKEEKDQFISNWKNIEDSSKNVNESMQSLFYYYMFYIRATKNDTKSTTPGVRNFFLKYFKEEKDANLHNKIIESLEKINELWHIIFKLHENLQDKNQKFKWTKNKNILKSLDILTFYPNEFWKYPVVNFFLTNYDKLLENDDTTEKEFEIFLKKFSAWILLEYIDQPNINYIKPRIVQLNNLIFKRDLNINSFLTNSINYEIFKEKVKIPHNNILKMILKAVTYHLYKQEDLLPKIWETEHIKPKSWIAYSTDKETEKEFIEQIGNKIPIEKSTNIKASDDCFTIKKGIYENSNIEVLKNLSNSKIENWNNDKIEERTKFITEGLWEILNK